MLAEDDYPVWNGYLYQLQEEAPRPKAVLTNNPEAAIGRPHYFGDECHGLISREEGDMLCSEEGNFLIRESQKERGRYTLVIRILGTTKNFKLYWEDGQYFVGDKRFNDIYALVGDGLITMYVEEKARDYIQNMSKDRSVYSSLSRTRQLLTRQLPNHGPMDPRQSPRRAPSMRAQGFDNSPRHAHNGRNTESAALPYTYYQNHPVGNEPDCTGLEDKMVATHMMPDDDFYMQNSSYQPSQQGSSMLQNLMNSKSEGQGNYIPYQNGGLRNDSNKKSLTPTSSDERKRPRAKKIATEECITQQSYDYGAYGQQNIPKFVHGTAGISNYELSRTSSSGSNNTDSGGRGHHYSKPNVPIHLQNRPFHQSVPNSSSPTRSPMHRNNSDPTKPQTASYQYSMPAQHTHTHVAHVRQLGGVLGNNKAAFDLNNQGTVNGSSGARFENQGSEERIMLDANDNQMYLTVSQQSNAKGYHSPSRSRQSPRQPNFDSSSGSEVIPAKTFHQLKMFQRRLEEASDDDIHNEAKDEVTTLRGHPKASVRLTRSHTTVGMAPVVRPHSGKSTPKPAPREFHFRQRSEPVELYQHHSQRKASGQQFSQGDARQSGYPVRAKDQYLLPPEQNLASDLRSGSGGSCNSSLSNVSSVGQHSFHRPLDSLSHLSSEEWTGEERESSPSPQSTGHRSCSSDDSGGLKTRDFKPHLTRQNTVISAELTWQQRLAEERGNYIRGVEYEKDDTGVQSHVKSACVPPPESLSASKPRRKSSDFETSTRSKSQTNNKSRHHSETSSEEGTPRHQVVAQHKPLQRRATTGGSPSANKHATKQNGVMSPIKESKKLAHRSNSGPSPRKGKKSPECPMSPRTQHIHHQRSLSSPRNENVPYYDKEHVFKSHTYRGLQWCEYCGNFMWGIIQQGMQCRDCGLNVHKQCSKLVPGDCQPALKHVKTVFGIDLTALVKLHGTERPIVVDKCIEEIEKRGMDAEGIYRVSGFHDDVQELKLNFDRFGSEVDLSSYEDINIVAGGLKLYLRELPVPLIPYNLYSRFINAAKLAFADGKLEAIKTAIDMLPPAHLQTLKHIIQHLSKVCDREANHMTSQNLSIVFGPTMLRPPEKSAPSRYSLNDTQYQQEIVQTIIENRTELFRSHKDNMTIRETPIL